MTTRGLQTARPAAEAVAPPSASVPSSGAERMHPLEELGHGLRAPMGVAGRRGVVERLPASWASPRTVLGANSWGMKELVVALRWVAIALSLAAAGLGKPNRADVVAAAVLVVLAIARTVWPLEPGSATGEGKSRGGAKPASGLVELAVCVAVVAATGGAGSPFAVSLAAACFVCGLVVPVVVVASVAVAGIAALGAAGEQGALAGPLAARDIEGLAVLGVLSLLGSYSDWLLRKDHKSKDEEVERLRNLGEINYLLLELHAKAASAPTALSLKAAVATVAGRLRTLLAPDVVALVLSDRIAHQGGGRWEVVLAEGVELPDVLRDSALAPALREAAGSLGPVCRSRLGRGEGVALEAWSGMYVPLWAHDSLIGLLAVERVTTGRPFGGADLDMVESVARHAGLALDNARLFRRLRVLGAEEERVRIARELHDRVGQSLAYLALSLDSLQAQAGSAGAVGGPRMSTELGQLAAEARRVLRELRTKLSDLRTEVTDETGLVDAVVGLLARAEQRAGISATLSAGPLAALPPEVGREVARVAEEAVNNAERHSGATQLAVRLAWDGQSGELVVADNGRGMPASASLRRDAFGILGMRERAEAIGGTLAISAKGGGGTTVTLNWGDGVARR